MWGQADDAESEKLLERYSGDEAEIELIAEGNPNDAAFAGLVERHEEHHVEDLKAGIASILKPWDEKIQSHTRAPFVARSAGSAEEEFFQHVGGTPAELGALVGKHFKDTGEAFHDTTEGRPPVIDRLMERGWWTKKAYFRWKHPLS